MKSLPFKEENISKSIKIREFSKDVISEELEWHQDEESRWVISLNETDWMIQLDNKKPQSLNEGVYINQLEWHRLIKGSENLKVKIIKF
jgi:hypothetical protein